MNIIPSNHQKNKAPYGFENNTLKVLKVFMFYMTGELSKLIEHDVSFNKTKQRNNWLTGWVNQ